jgi:hypothetical protein
VTLTVPLAERPDTLPCTVALTEYKVAMTLPVWSLNCSLGLLSLTVKRDLPSSLTGFSGATTYRLASLRAGAAETVVDRCAA